MKNQSLKGRAANMFTSPSKRPSVKEGNTHKNITISNVPHGLLSEISFREQKSIKALIEDALRQDGLKKRDMGKLNDMPGKDVIQVHTSIDMESEINKRLCECAHYSGIPAKCILESAAASYLRNEYGNKYPDLFVENEQKYKCVEE